MKFLKTITTPDRLISADGVESFDLAVNPLSVILIGLRPLNETATLANHARYKAITQALNRVSVLYRGESIVSARGEDLAAMNWLRHGLQLWEANPDNVDNERRAVFLPIFLGRMAYDPKSCFPATKRGELVLECDFDIADTGYDGLRFSVDCIELLDAKPSEFEKKVQVTQTMAATGDQDLDLPVGNPCRGVLLFGTTGFAGAAPAPSWGRIKTLLDNQEHGYGNIDWETAHILPAIRGVVPQNDHKHTVNAAGAGIEETASGPFDYSEDFTQYAFLDFDPTRDDMYTLDTRGHSRFHVRGNVETADAVRAIPVEVIKLAS